MVFGWIARTIQSAWNAVSSLFTSPPAAVPFTPTQRSEGIKLNHDVTSHDQSTSYSSYDADIQESRRRAAAERAQAERERANAARARAEVEEANQRRAQEERERAEERAREAEQRRQEEEQKEKKLRLEYEEIYKEKLDAEARRLEIEASTRQAKQASQHAAEVAELERKNRLLILERDWGPRPSHIPSSYNSIGFFGRSGVGKTSLWNCCSKILFKALVPPEEMDQHKGSIPHGATGACETTLEPASYQIPETFVNVIDNPGHGTVAFDTMEYIKRFGVGYYFKRFYVFSGRLLETDVRMMLQFIVFDLEFVLVRQKFQQDLESFAKSEYEELNNTEDPFADEDEDELMKVYMQSRMEEPSFIAKCKARLHDEMRKNLTEVVSNHNNPFIRDNQARWLSHKIDFYCVDSRKPKLYDWESLLEYAMKEPERRRDKPANVSKSRSTCHARPLHDHHL